MSNLSDEQLLKRADHSGRNLGVLAVLASLAALVLVSLPLVKGVSIFTGIVGIGAGMLAAAYWVLMVAAKRGDPASMTGPVIAVAAQIALGVGMVALAGANSPESAGSSAAGLIVPVIVLLVLYGNQKELLELQGRGLWQKAFGSAKPSGSLCLIGNGLLLAGFLGFNGGVVLTGVWTGVSHAKERQKAQVFPALLQNEEQAFMNSLNKAVQAGQGEDQSAAAAARAEMFARLAALKAKVEEAKTQSASNKTLLGVLTTYSRAVDLWKKGLETMAADGGDVAAGQKMLNRGDAVRSAAVEEFNKRYASPPDRR